MNKYNLYDKYAEYEYEDNRREKHRSRRQRTGGKARSPKHVPAALSDFSDNVTRFVPSYAAGLDEQHYERRWLIDSVAPFYQDGLITDVTRRVKGGKEANVYTCMADPATGFDLLAAKLYRPRMLRHLRNDAVYKAGRQLRDEDGKQMKGRRVKLALKKKTKFGKQVDIGWWIQNEFATQKKMYEAGVDVPKPIAHQGTALLMEFVGDASMAAPTLNQVRLDEDEAAPLFEQIMDNVALMLDLHFIHGDLSAYNILYWEGEVTIIDFPQTVEARVNPHAFELLQRDITRICEYFAGYGVEADPVERTLALWEPYMGPGW